MSSVAQCIKNGPAIGCRSLVRVLYALDKGGGQIVVAHTAVALPHLGKWQAGDFAVGRRAARPTPYSTG
ncbi:hypothetical protein HaLaN_32951 [Haematococcus lacustris]|uniref:Uncharacterized protein n=1 Tax=Haematococcus lacustris TaxID=44745 RepID=A0A6A0AMV3_HAELA|nr:hypothetical protein HaLaN_32951 [Haematococcus lacustris]